MAVSVVWRRQLTDGVERILHTQGNYKGGILEMLLVLDYHMPREQLKARAAEIAGILKGHSEVFRNVRLNVIKWTSDGQIIKEISALPRVQTGTLLEDYETVEGGQAKLRQECLRTWDELLRQMKLFYARSKVVLVLTDSPYFVADGRAAADSLNPFLYRRLLVPGEKEIINGMELLRAAKG